VLFGHSAFAGELYEQSGWNYKNPPSPTGAKQFDSIFTLGLNTHGATIAYLDLKGNADAATLYSQVTGDTGVPSPITPNTWLKAVASVPSSGLTNDGWTRFDFRSLKLLVTDFLGGLPNFEGGAGPYFGFDHGSFQAFDRYQQDVFKGTVVYWDMPSATIPKGPYPVFRVFWETLDAPYVDTNGDADRDGRVDLNDFGILKASFGEAVGYRMVADFNGNLVVDGGDFAILKNNFGWKAGSAVPEPSSGLLAWLALGLTIAWLQAGRCNSRRKCYGEILRESGQSRTQLGGRRTRLLLRLR